MGTAQRRTEGRSQHDDDQLGQYGYALEQTTVTVYVRPTRFTHKFMNENEYFTVSFFPQDKREALTKMGTITGRHKKIGRAHV